MNKKEIAQKQGSIYGKRGNKLEHSLVEELSSSENLLNYKKDLPLNDIYSLIVNRILLDCKLNKEDITLISATNKVPSLRSGGNPKTDILLKIKTTSGKEFIETLSIKNTQKPKVSCHDYSVVDFIRVLKCENTKLAAYLSHFQKHPSYRDFEKHLSDGDSIKEFVELLREKEIVFNEWVLMGKHDIYNLTEPEIQVSKYLFIHYEKKSAFYSFTEYISLLKTKRTNEKFGVPFSWTYPSKQRDKRIQLKVAIFFEIENSIEYE